MSAWNIKEADNRAADSIFTFIIFCEDEASELIYLKYFETLRIKINLIPRQKSSIESVINAINHCQVNGLLVADESGKESLQNCDTQVWCVFDRDRNEVNYDKDCIAFDESITMAKSKGFGIAWSNDAFELWILLHFESIDPQVQANSHRNSYYNRLTEIFLTLHSNNQDLTRIQAEPIFQYKTFLKSRKNFSNIVLKEIVNNISLAINRAELLENFYKTTHSNHQKAPCTMMHHLVKELLLYGQKNV